MPYEEEDTCHMRRRYFIAVSRSYTNTIKGHLRTSCP